MMTRGRIESALLLTITIVAKRAPWPRRFPSSSLANVERHRRGQASGVRYMWGGSPASGSLAPHSIRPEVERRASGPHAPTSHSRRLSAIPPGEAVLVSTEMLIPSPELCDHPGQIALTTVHRSFAGPRYGAVLLAYSIVGLFVSRSGAFGDGAISKSTNRFTAPFHIPLSEALLGAIDVTAEALDYAHKASAAGLEPH